MPMKVKLWPQWNCTICHAQWGQLTDHPVADKACQDCCPSSSRPETRGDYYVTRMGPVTKEEAESMGGDSSAEKEK